MRYPVTILLISCCRGAAAQTEVLTEYEQPYQFKRSKQTNAGL